jgi:hypothetical protein
VDYGVLAIGVEGSNVYVGGDFDSAGGLPHTSCIARWDVASATWHALGNGLNYDVYAFAVDGSDIYMGGDFTDAGGFTTTDKIVRWDGYNWHSLGSGLNNTVYAVAVLEPYVYVGGWFTAADDNPANYIARWEANDYLYLPLAIRR